MQIVDVYDKYKNLTGKKILKNQYNELDKGEYTLFTYVAIFNDENEMLKMIRSIGEVKSTNQFLSDADMRILDMDDRFILYERYKNFNGFRL